MFKVIIVDDEPIIRKGLRSIINWQQYDCEVCGEAEDGLEGYDLIKEHQPDIIFTDIKMQEMDGLTMIREVKEILPGGKIIILSGYRDFEYAREAVQLGAFDFLLKPSRVEDINAVLGRAVRELRRERDAAEEMDKFKVLFEQNIPMLREKMLYDAMHGINVDDDELVTKMDLYHIDIHRFILVVIENDSEDGKKDKETTPYNRQLYQLGIVNFFIEAFDEYDVMSVSLNLKRIAFIVQTKHKDSGYDKLGDQCARFQESIKNFFGFTISIGVSTEGEDIFQLARKLKECQHALEHKLYIGNNSLISYKDLALSFKYEDYSTLENYKEVLLDGIKLGNIETVKESLCNIFKYIKALGHEINKDIKDFYWNTISSVNNIRISVLSRENPDNMEDYGTIDSLYKLINECGNIEDLNDILKDVCMKVAERVNSFNHKSINLKVQTIMDYVDQHYCEPITLNDIGESIYASTYYASRIFKQETGKNFVDYLNEVRIEKAKEFLRDVQYKVYEVADLVGIPDAHYFSKLFRKYVGTTPREFRDMNLAAEK